jgi:hypothetical protein
MDAWCPFAIRNPSPYAEVGTWAASAAPSRGVLHTTEADIFRPHPRLYYGIEGTHPHVTVGRGILPDGRAGVASWQHHPSTRPSRALRNLPGGVETNRLRVFNIEVVARAATVAALDDATYTELARIMRWAELELGIAPVILTMFAYPPPNGIRLNGREPWRLTFTEWLAFNGWCGHQHVPENVHGDPGALDTERLEPADIVPIITPPASIDLEESTVRNAFVTLAHKGYGIFEGWWEPGLGAPPVIVGATLHGPSIDDDGPWPWSLGATIRAQVRGDRILVTAAQAAGAPAPPGGVLHAHVTAGVAA